MDPGTASLIVGGAGILSNALGLGQQKQQQVNYSNPSQDYLALYGPILAAGNTDLTRDLAGAQIAQGKLSGTEAAALSLGANTQSNYILNQLSKESQATQLQAGIGSALATGNIQLPYQAGLGKLATELTPTETLKKLSESYGTGLSDITKTGTGYAGEISKQAPEGTVALGREGLAQEGKLAGQLLDDSSQLGQIAQNVTGLLGQSSLQGKTTLEQQTLANEKELLQPTATALAQAGYNTLAGQNQAVNAILNSNLRINEKQEDLRGRLAEYRALGERDLAKTRYGAQLALAGNRMFA